VPRQSSVGLHAMLQVSDGTGSSNPFRFANESLRTDAGGGVAFLEACSLPRVDYSGGTGILLDRLKLRIFDRKAGILIADASPRFLRVALEKFAKDQRVGRTAEALGMLNKGLEHIKRTSEKVHQADMLRLRGELLLMRDGGAAAEAEGCFRMALEVARAREAKWFELRATTSLAKLLAKRDRHDEARAKLAEIYGWFTEGFDTADLKDAKAFLEELSV